MISDITDSNFNKKISFNCIKFLNLPDFFDRMTQVTFTIKATYMGIRSKEVNVLVLQSPWRSPPINVPVVEAKK